MSVTFLANFKQMK